MNESAYLARFIDMILDRHGSRAADLLDEDTVEGYRFRGLHAVAPADLYNEEATEEDRNAFMAALGSLHAISSEGRPGGAVGAPPPSAKPSTAGDMPPTGRKAAPSDRQSAIWLTDAELSWLGERVGSTPGHIGHGSPPDTVYRKIRDTLTLLAIMDESGQA